MKKRISIYIDGDVWDGVKENAWRARMSASGYLEDLICRESYIPIKIEKGAEEVLVGRGDEEVAESFFNPMSKDRQLGKGGK